MKIILIFTLFSFVCTSASSQNSRSPLEARITLIQNKLEDDGKQIAILNFSFINNSDESIYVPEIFKISAGAKGGFLKISKIINSKAIRLPFYGAPIEHSRHTFSGYVNKIQREYNLKYKEYYSNMQDSLKNYLLNTTDKLDSLTIFDFETRPLFIKAHEVLDFFFPVSIDRFLLKEIGEYVISYEPEMGTLISDNWPKKILGYRKVIPKSIPSNTLYITVVE